MRESLPLQKGAAEPDVTLSYASGPADVPLLHDTIGRCLEKAAVQWPSTDAVVSVQEGIRWTYAELDRRAAGLAAGLLGLGLVPGDRIGVWGQNSANWLLLQFAATRAGLILVSFNTAYRSAELTYVLNKVGCRALVMDSTFKRISYVDIIEAVDAPSLAWRILFDEPAREGFIGFASLFETGAAADTRHVARVERAIQFDDVVNIQFTSGTTGRPKGVTLTHHNLVNNGYFVGARAGLREGDRICVPVPLFHCFGMVMASLAAVTHGATMVFPAAAFDPEATLRAIEQERCTLLYGVPTMFIAQLNHPSFAEFDLKTLRGGIMAGSPCPAEVMRQVIERMNMREVTIAYGMTETSPVSLQTRTSDSMSQRVETVGTIMPHLEVKIVDSEGCIVPRGEQGELCTRGYSVMRGYWDDPEATSGVVDESRWMHSGDLASMDDDGFVRITGRIKDLIIRGGENISPREIEEFLYEHPDVMDVQVIGVPDPVFGEAVCAWLIVRPGASLTVGQLTDYCRGRIAHYKIPKHFRFVDAFPTTASGKVQKVVMREQMATEMTGRVSEE